jgi:hypothetical protein
MFGGVLAGDGLAARSFRAGGFLGVKTVGSDLFGGGHKF